MIQEAMLLFISLIWQLKSFPHIFCEKWVVEQGLINKMLAQKQKTKTETE